MEKNKSIDELNGFAFIYLLLFFLILIIFILVFLSIIPGWSLGIIIIIFLIYLEISLNRKSRFERDWEKHLKNFEKKEEKNQKRKFVNSKSRSLDFCKPKPPLS